MTDGVQVKLLGATDVLAAFRELREYLKTAIRRAVREGADLMLGFVVLLAPSRTGKLRSNLSVRIRRTKETIRARVVVATVGKADNPKNSFYWRFLEKGWTTVRGKVMRFQFVQVAYEARQQQAAQQVIDEVDKAIKRAEKRARRANLRR